MKLTSLFVFVFLLSVSFVSAQYYGGYGSSYGGGFFGITQQAIDSFVQNIAPILQILLGGQDWTGYLLFEKTLLFILISIIVGLVLTKVPVFESVKNKGLLRFIAVIIALLGVRNLNYIWIGTILVQYQVLFIAVAGILPFLIYWAFVKDLDPWLCKVAWIFYSIIYIGLWATTELEAYASVYLWGAIAALVYAFFLDVQVRRWMKKKEMLMWDHQRKWERIDGLDKRIKSIQDSQRPESDKKKIIGALENERKGLIDNLPFS